MIEFYYKTIQDKKLIKLSEFKKGSLIYVFEPTDDDLKYLKEVLLLDKKLLADALDVNEIPRIEIKRSIVYIFLRSPVRKNKHISTLPFLIAISSEFILIFSRQKIKIIENFLKRGVFSTTQRTRVFLKILFRLLNFYEKIIIYINKEIKTIGVDLKKLNEEVIKNFVNFEIILQELLTSLVPTKHSFSNILKKKILLLFEKDKELIEDLILKIEQLEDLSKSSLKHITHIREAYEVILANVVNKAIKFLTALTIIFSIPTIIASFFGMNVALPFEKNPFAFLIILIISLTLMIIFFVYFYFKNWL